VFREQFADLVVASGLSTRDIEKRSGKVHDQRLEERHGLAE
jgi:transposase